MKIKKVNEMKNSDNFIEWINNRSDKDEIIDILQLEGEEVSPNVYDFYGDMISGVKIDVDELEGFGTSCGRKDNTCFDNEIIGNCIYYRLIKSKNGNTSFINLSNAVQNFPFFFFWDQKSI